MSEPIHPGLEHPLLKARAQISVGWSFPSKSRMWGLVDLPQGKAAIMLPTARKRTIVATLVVIAAISAGRAG